MVTGRRAFAGGSRAETLAAVRPGPAEATERDRRGGAEGPGEADPALPAQGAREALPAHGRREGRARGDQGGLGLGAGGRPSAGPLGRRRAWLAAALALALVAGGGRCVPRGARPRQPPPPPPQVVALTTTSRARRVADVLARREPDRLLLGRRGRARRAAPPRLGHLAEDDRLVGGAPADDGPRRRPLPELVSGRTADRVSSGTPPPDERFSRRTSGEIHVVSPLGGADRKVERFPRRASQLAWSPDGRWLVAGARVTPGDSRAGAGALQLVIRCETASRARSPRPSRPATTPPRVLTGRATPRLRLRAPSGAVRRATSRSWTWGRSSCREARPDGCSRRPRNRSALTWSRDGRSLVYSARETPSTKDVWRLWRAAGDAAPPERLELAPQGAVAPPPCASQDRLAFTRTRLRHSTSTASSPAARRGRSWPRPIPDDSPELLTGRAADRFRVRRGPGSRQEIWLADADGSNPVQLTHGPGVGKARLRFSPDGRRIVFELPRRGRVRRRLDDRRPRAGRRAASRTAAFTDGPARAGLATAASIYYREDRADGRDIGRIPAAGGTPERVTRNGGLFARESADGKTTLLHADATARRRSSASTLPGGPERQVVDCVQSRSLADGPDGIYYLGCAAGRSEAPLYRLDPASAAGAGSSAPGEQAGHRGAGRVTRRRRRSSSRSGVDRGRRPDADRELPVGCGCGPAARKKT